MEQESNWRESLCKWRSCWELELPTRTDLCQNSRPYIVLKLPHDSHAILVFHWSWLFIGHGLHPCNACSPLVVAFHWPWFTPMQCLFSIDHSLHLCMFLVIIFLILSTARCICQQHLLGSLQVKVIYYLNPSTLFPSYRQNNGTTGLSDLARKTSLEKGKSLNWKVLFGTICSIIVHHSSTISSSKKYGWVLHETSSQ